MAKETVLAALQSYNIGSVNHAEIMLKSCTKRDNLTFCKEN